jgi:hypothetical protein
VLDGAADTELRALGVCAGDLLWVVGLEALPQAALEKSAVEVAEPALQCIEALSPPPCTSLPQARMQQAEVPQESSVLDSGKRAAAAPSAASDEAVDEDPELPPSQRLPTYFLRTVQHNCRNDTESAELLLLAAHAALLETGFVPAWSGCSPGGSMYQVPRTCWVSTSTCKISYHLGHASVALGREDMEAAAAGSEQLPVCTLQCSSLGGGGVVLAVAARTHTRYIPLQAAAYVCKLPNTAAPAPAAAGSSSHAASIGHAAGAQPALTHSIVQLLADGGLSIAGRLHMDPVSTRRLWTAVKDALAFPLLLAAYAEAGLPAPAGLLALPEDLKLRLLDMLGVRDLLPCLRSFPLHCQGSPLAASLLLQSWQPRASTVIHRTSCPRMPAYIMLVPHSPWTWPHAPARALSCATWQHRTPSGALCLSASFPGHLRTTPHRRSNVATSGPLRLAGGSGGSARRTCAAPAHASLYRACRTLPVCHGRPATRRWAFWALVVTTTGCHSLDPVQACLGSLGAPHWVALSSAAVDGRGGVGSAFIDL